MLSITSVHPMREEGVNEFLTKAKADWNIIEKLINEDDERKLYFPVNDN